MFILLISRSSFIMRGVGSKSRSLGQILEKYCLRSRGLMFGPIFLKLAQDGYIDDISVKFDRGWGGVKTKVTRTNLRKKTHSWGHLFGPICPKLAQNVCLDDISVRNTGQIIMFNIGHNF